MYAPIFCITVLPYDNLVGAFLNKKLACYSKNKTQLSFYL